MRWVQSSLDELEVDVSTGTSSAGFILWGSNEDSDQLIATTGYQVWYGYGVVCTGSWLIGTRTFEQYTYASRLGGPLVALTYPESAPLYVSLSGKLTTEDEWALSSDPRGAASPVGTVAKTLTNGYVTAYITC